MNVCEWAEEHWIIPETKKPIRLRSWQRKALFAIHPREGGPSPWQTFLISLPKKTGKTETNAIATGYAALVRPAPELLLCVANDAEQAEQRVFERIARAFRAMGLVGSGSAVLTKDTITLPETGTIIRALPADYAGAAGSLHGVVSFTELWSYQYEAHLRLFEELTLPPNRHAIRIVDSYAGYCRESKRARERDVPLRTPSR